MSVDTTGNSALNLPRRTKSENDTSEVIKDIATNICEGEGEKEILARHNASSHAFLNACQARYFKSSLPGQKM